MKILLGALILSLVSVTGFATTLGPVVKKSEATALGFYCDDLASGSPDVCYAQWRTAKSFCEQQGSRLPTILELATIYSPNLVIAAPAGSDYPLPFKEHLSNIDAFNYDGFIDPKNPLKKLDQFYFDGYKGVISNYGPDKVDGSTFWSLSTRNFGKLWTVENGNIAA